MTRALVVSLTLVGASACMHADRRASTPTASAAAQASPDRAMMHAGMAGMCPMSVPGTRVAAADTPTGEALTFTTAPDQVTALRERVHAMAEMHNQHHAGGHHMAGMAGEADAAMTMPPPSQAAVEDVADGARLVVTPKEPADLQRLQATVRQHATMMQEHGCGMMSGEGHGG